MNQLYKNIFIGFALAILVELAVVYTQPAHGAEYDANGNTVTVVTEAGKITVAPDFADKMRGFISDLVARGYKPKHIGCYSWAKSHVRHSLHHTGHACDFDQRGWGKTSRIMYHVRDLTRKWGLRNGCDFGDCGHVDAGRPVTQLEARSRSHAR